MSYTGKANLWAKSCSSPLPPPSVPDPQQEVRGRTSASSLNPIKSRFIWTQTNEQRVSWEDYHSAGFAANGWERASEWRGGAAKVRRGEGLKWGMDPVNMTPPSFLWKVCGPKKLHRAWTHIKAIWGWGYARVQVQHCNLRLHICGGEASRPALVCSEIRDVAGMQNRLSLEHLLNFYKLCSFESTTLLMDF